MKAIIILDKNNGMSFNHRRQSRDSEIINKLGEIIKDSNILMHPYSLSLFENTTKCNVLADEEYLQIAGENDFCFTEREHLSDYLTNITEIIVFRWDKIYPSDHYLDIPIPPPDFSLNFLDEFKGSSHEIITMEVFQR